MSLSTVFTANKNQNPRIVILAFVMMCTGLTPATAAVNSGIKDNTTCYVFKQDKLFKKSSCRFTADIGGSTTYGISDYDFNIKGFGNISTYSHSNAVTDKQGEPIINADGSVKSTISIMIDSKPAIATYRNATTFKPMTQTQVQAGYAKTKNKGTLSCIAAKDKSLEICVPLFKTNLEHG